MRPAQQLARHIAGQYPNLEIVVREDEVGVGGLYYRHAMQLEGARIAGGEIKHLSSKDSDEQYFTVE
jgi:hypothetical protein